MRREGDKERGKGREGPLSLHVAAARAGTHTGRHGLCTQRETPAVCVTERDTGYTQPVSLSPCPCSLRCPRLVNRYECAVLQRVLAPKMGRCQTKLAHAKPHNKLNHIVGKMGCCQTKLAKGANGKVKLEAVDDEAPENEPQVLGRT